MATVELIGVRKRFGKLQVIHGVDVAIDDGEFIVIVGPSGCGKSTLLRMVAGLESVSEGEVRIGGERVNEREPMDRDVAMVFQNYALYPHMSVRRNMGYGLKIAGWARADIDAKVTEVARLLQLGQLLDRKPRELSGGQRQRVAMGRAIVRQPAAFLFDEPLSNLDAKLRVQMRLEIRALQRKLGTTALYVTHDQVEAMTMADRMIVMNEGRVDQIGSPLAVYERPSTMFAAQFIGSPAMNVFEARIESGMATLPGGARVRVDSAHVGEACLGVRPEHLAIDSDGPLSMSIRQSEALGATTLVHGDLMAGAGLVTVSVAGAYHGGAVGSEVRLSAQTHHLHLFDPVTGSRIA
ncbi:MAG: sn-glycerol-3-phosphate ABC transporter ATP-binding protein UgpC [Burkholderiaceae bacterium]